MHFSKVNYSYSSDQTCHCYSYYNSILQSFQEDSADLLLNWVMLVDYPFNSKQRNYCYYSCTFAIISSMEGNYGFNSPFLTREDILKATIAIIFLATIRRILIVFVFVSKFLAFLKTLMQLFQFNYSFQDHLNHH